MLPVIHAQETLTELMTARAGAGRIKRNAERQIGHDLAKKARDPGKSKPAQPADLAARGAAVRAVARPAWADRLTTSGR